LCGSTQNNHKSNTRNNFYSHKKRRRSKCSHSIGKKKRKKKLCNWRIKPAKSKKSLT
jgi:hypothetical protein